MEGVAVHLIKGKISREWVIDFTRLHEQWNYDFVLVGYYASAAEGFASRFMPPTIPSGSSS